MELFLYSALTGLVYGLLLFLIAAGLTLVFGIMGVVNFAHASFYMLGAYFAYVLTQYIGFWGSLLVAPMLVAIIGIMVERFLLRPAHKYGHSHEILITFGLVFVFEEVVKLFFGNRLMDYSVPRELNFPAFSVLGIDYPFYRLLVGLVAIVLFVMLFAVLHWTRIGTLVRAAVQRPEMVGALGHNVPRLFMTVFGIGTWMAGVAGVVGGALLTTSPEMGMQMAIPTFVVVVVGGLGSLSGALYASLLIGVCTFVMVTLDVSLADAAAVFGLEEAFRQIGGLLTVKLSTLSSSVPILLMLVILLLRPSGLKGDRA